MPKISFKIRFGGLDIRCTDGTNRFVPWNLIGVGDSIGLRDAQSKWPELPERLLLPGLGTAAVLAKLKKRYVRRRLRDPSLEVSWVPPGMTLNSVVLLAIALMHGGLFFQYILGPRSFLAESPEVRSHFPIEYWLFWCVFAFGTLGVAAWCLSCVFARWIRDMTRPFPTRCRIVPGMISVSLSDGRIIDAPWSRIKGLDGLEGKLSVEQAPTVTFHPQKSSEARHVFEAIAEGNGTQQCDSRRLSANPRLVARWLCISLMFLAIVAFVQHFNGVPPLRALGILVMLIATAALLAATMWIQIHKNELARNLYKWRRKSRNRHRPSRYESQ